MASAIGNVHDKAGWRKKGGVFSEFPGLESVVANPKSNEIWAAGTSESITKLRGMISYLDRPVRLVEIKVQFIEVGKADIADLDMPIVSGSSTKVFAAQSGFQDKLTELIRTKRARVFHSSQVVTVNNSQAKASSITNALAPALEWTAIPTIQNDNTITLFFTPQINLNPKRFMTTAASIKAGDQMVFAMNIADKERPEILVIVSAHIVED